MVMTAHLPFGPVWVQQCGPIGRRSAPEAQARRPGAGLHTTRYFLFLFGMSYASQQAFEALGELVEDLMERLEAAEAKADKVAGLQAEVAALQDELATTRAELTAEVGTIHAELTAERESRHRTARALRNVQEQQLSENSFLLELGGGTGGQSEESVYASPSGLVVNSSHPTCRNSKNHYHIEHLFSGTQTEGGADFWLVGPSKQALLEFVFPAPIIVSRIRLHTHRKNSAYGISSFTLTLVCESEVVAPPISRDDIPRGEWVELSLDQGLITKFTLDFATSTKYLGVNSIEVYVNPHSALLSTVNGLLPFLAHDLGDNGGEGASSST